jgi:hypothetical protein
MPVMSDAILLVTDCSVWIESAVHPAEVLVGDQVTLANDHERVLGLGAAAAA